MSSPVWFSIPEFTGIQQHKDGRLLPISSASDAYNVDTSDGNLSVAKGFSRLANYSAVPGTGNILKLIPVDTAWASFYVVASNTIYMWDKSNSLWYTMRDNDNLGEMFHPGVLAFSPALSTKQVDTLQTRIGDDDVILVCTGETQPYVIYNSSGNHGYARKFGSGLYSYEGTVQSYASGTKTITLSTNMPDDARRRARIYGITYGNNIHAEVSSTFYNTLVLAETPMTPPAANDAVKISGGAGSNANVAYAETYANRLFAAGDPSAPCRLYWSAVPGDGRTIEDWGMVEGDADASGGYVEVGDTHYDPIVGLTVLSNQLLIWKRYSVWRLYGDRPSTFTLEKVERDFSAISNAGVLVYHDAPYMLTKDGLFTYDTVGLVPVDKDGNHLKQWFGSSILDLSNSRCAFYNGRFYFGCREGVEAKENRIVTFDTTNGSYIILSGFWFYDIAAFGKYLYIVTSRRYVCKFDNSDMYDVEPIVATWRTQPIDFGKKMNKHQVMAMYMQLKGGDVRIRVRNDAGAVVSDQVVHYTPGSSGFVVNRIQADQSHMFSFQFDNAIDDHPTGYPPFSIQGGINIKCLSELKE